MTGIFPSGQLHADIAPVQRTVHRPPPTALIRYWLTLGDTMWIARRVREGRSQRLLDWLFDHWPPEAPIPDVLRSAVLG